MVMFNLFIRAIVIYVFLLIAMRFMGKRQLGELQPFEFAITLIVAELACIPMSDNAIPLIYGIIPIATLVVVHSAISQISLKSIRFRKLLNGKPQILISQGVADCQLLKKCSMTANDLLEGLRGEGIFSIEEVEYALLETNGKISVMPKAQFAPVTPQDMELQVPAVSLPYNVVIEGKFMGENIGKMQNGVTEADIKDFLDAQKIKWQSVFIMTLKDDKSLFLQTNDGKVIKTLLEKHDTTAHKADSLKEGLNI